MRKALIYIISPIQTGRFEDYNMKLIEYKYSYHSWGHDKEELYRIDIDSKEYMHFDHGICDDTLLLPDDLIDSICSIFDSWFRESFPKDEFAWDAPMWTLTIDDKTCTRIALVDADPIYSKISNFFVVFKKTASSKNK